MAQETLDLLHRVSKTGHICYRPVIELGVRARATDGGIAYPQFPFILDTGSDISLIPATVVRLKHLLFEPHPRQAEHRPVTLAGPMAVGQWGDVYILYLDRIIELPSFVYEPKPSNKKLPQEVKGPPGQKRFDRPIRTGEQWIAEHEKVEDDEEQEDDRSEQEKFVLGRAEFLDKHSILIQDRRITISTEKLRRR